MSIASCCWSALLTLTSITRRASRSCLPWSVDGRLRMRLLRFPWAAQWLRYPSSFRLPEERLEDESKVVTVRHEPLGVVVAICPWNFPIMLGM